MSFFDTISQGIRRIDNMLMGKSASGMKSRTSDDHIPGMDVPSIDDIVEAKGYDAYRSMRRDAEVAAGTSIRLTAMIPGLQIQPADGDEDAKKAAQLISSVMQMMDGELEYVLRDQMCDEAVTMGLMVAEPKQAVVEVPDFGKVLGLESIYVRPAECFENGIKVDQYGTIESFKQRTLTGTIPLKPADVVHYAYRGQPWNPYGRSVYHSAYDYWKLKQALVRYFAEFATVNASGIKEYVIPDEDFQKDKDNALERLKELVGAAAIVRKKSHELNLHIPTGVAGYHFIRATRELCNIEIRKSILMDETINAEGMRTGSRASREISENVMYTVMASEGRAFCTSVAEQLFRRILDWNGFINWPIPKLIPEPVPERNADPAPILQSLTQAYTAGVITDIPSDVRDQILRQSLRPMGVDYERQAPEEGETQRTQAYSFAGAPPGRTRADMLKLKKEAKAAEKEAQGEFLGVWEAVKPDVKDGLNKALFDRAGKWKTKKYASIRKAVEQNISKGGSKLRKVLTGTLFCRYESGRDDAAKMIKTRGAVQVTPKIVNPSAAREMLSQHVYLTLGSTYDGMRDDIYYILENAINGNVSEREAMSQLNQYLDSKGITPGRATTIVNTSLSHAYNEGRMSLFNSIADPTGIVPGGIIGYQYSAVMDNATTDTCIGFDDMFFRVDDPSLPQPPLHHNCRSVLIPVFTGEEPWKNGEWADPAVSKSMSATIPQGFGGN